MGTIEIIILCAVGVLCIGGVFAIFFSKKKKKKAKEEKAPEPKVEPVYKQTQKPEEKKEEAPKVVMPTEFKIIRKKSEIKINKKAIKTDSRNPSITRVFVNGKNVEEEQKKKDAVPENQVKKKSTLSDIARTNIGRFGTREPYFCDRPIVQEGAPNRLPIIEDRTNFASHLREQGEESAIVIGAKAVEEKTAKIEKAINSRSNAMLEKVKDGMLVDIDPDPQTFLSEPRVFETKKKMQSIDAQTLILADAVSKRKGK